MVTYNSNVNRLDQSIWKTLVRLGVVIRRPTRRGRRAGGLKQTGLAVMAHPLYTCTYFHKMCRAPNKQEEWNKSKQPGQSRLPQTRNNK